MHGFGSIVIAAAIVAATAWPALAADGSITGDPAPYRSPYRIALPWPVPDLIPDLLKGERGDPRQEARIPESAWYNHRNPRLGPWGPLPRLYGPPSIAEGKSDDWKRARILATALRFLGYSYRHHYIPDWNPPPGWHIPKPGGTRHDGKGLDCSNFTSFVYNQGLGIGISSDVRKQAATQTATLQGSDTSFPVAVIPCPDTAAGWEKVLKPGDLLFIRPLNGDFISHVVIWVGDWGLPSGQPLVLDSHGADVRDTEGNLIPAGIQLRPFRMNSWYATHADHAIRLIGAQDAKGR